MAVGAAVGIARNALAALDIIGPSAADTLDGAGAVPRLGVRFMLGQGPSQGALIDEADAKAEHRRLTSIVHRAAWLKELLSDVPSDCMHTSKKLLRVDTPTAGPLTLHFTGGTTHECDILIGADGIYSTVRGIILRKDNTATQPRNSGQWLVMALIPYEKAQASLGNDLVNIDDAREYMWTGDGHFMLHNVLSGGKEVQFVIATKDDDAVMSDRWQQSVSIEEMQRFFQHGLPHLNKAVTEASASLLNVAR
ncbi:hypothetical protein N0V82_003913 [Gnomoniopsis sp. IMI 355080]|nr:hypothetical protein N0V82_003913 [Gnomoniopsis sp. IMI 355080]